MSLFCLERQINIGVVNTKHNNIMFASAVRPMRGKHPSIAVVVAAVELQLSSVAPIARM